MIVKTEGIIIRTSRYSESSAITRIYTKTKGMLAFHIPGVYSAKATVKPSFLQPLQLIEMDFYLKETGTLNKIKEIKPLMALNTVHFDVHKAAIGMFISELILKTIKEEEENEQLYDFLFESILLLDKKDIPITNFPLFFLLEYTHFLGFYPDDTYYPEKPYFDLYEGKFFSSPIEESHMISPPASAFFGHMLILGKSMLNELTIPKTIRQILLKKLLDFYQVHMSGFYQLNSIKVIESMYRS